MMNPQEFDTSEGGLFYFETDSEGVKRLVYLCAQRKQADVMNDLENVPGPSTENAPEIPVSHDRNHLIPTNYHQHSDFPTKSEDELQLELLKKIRRVKINEQEATSLSYLHQGFECNFCGEEPMVGTRWHCTTCTTDSVDFCTDCILAQLYYENYHPFSHNFITFNDKNPEAASELESNMKTNTSDSTIVDDITEVSLDYLDSGSTPGGE